MQADLIARSSLISSAAGRDTAGRGSSHPGSAAQRRLAVLAESSSRQTQLQSLANTMSAGLPQAGEATAQRMADEEEPAQARRADAAPAQLASAEEEEPAQMQAAPNRTGLPDGLKAGVESLSGMSLDNVRVHYNSDKPAQLNALAYAQGGDIHVGPGQEKHLPHEAWHVVQQAQGRVRPTMQMQAGGVPVNDDPSLETEADVMGARASQLRPAE